MNENTKAIFQAFISELPTPLAACKQGVSFVAILMREFERHVREGIITEELDEVKMEAIYHHTIKQYF